MISYSLVENLLTAAPNDFMAQTVNVREIVQRIMGRRTNLQYGVDAKEEFFNFIIFNT